MSGFEYRAGQLVREMHSSNGMKLDRTICLGFLLLTIAPVSGQLSDDSTRKFDEAARSIKKLPPASFPQLPGPVVRDLQRRGCTIPQESFTKNPHNVIQGEFSKRGQTDWAVLCSVKGVSTILVFWNGSAKNPASVALMADRNFLQGITASEVGFSRSISAVGKEFILGHYQAYGGPTPPPMEHEGIDDAFLEKASVTWYWYRGKWFKLTGAD
jgi:hypothetical protein